MRTSPTIKNNIKLLILLLLIPVLPLFSSVLLEWSFIQKFAVRQLIVYVLMLLEVAVIALMFLHEVKSSDLILKK